MVKKAIMIIIILIFTISLGIFEMQNVKVVLTTMEDSITDLNIQYEKNEKDISIYYDKVCDIKEYWSQKEDWLCFLFNHRDLSVITDSINRLQSYTKNNDYDNSIAELSMLKYYSSKNCHIMGFNIHNIL